MPADASLAEVGLVVSLADAVQLLNTVMRETPGDTLRRIERGELRIRYRAGEVYVLMADLLDLVRRLSDEEAIRRVAQESAREVAIFDAKRLGRASDPLAGRQVS